MNKYTIFITLLWLLQLANMISSVWLQLHIATIIVAIAAFILITFSMVNIWRDSDKYR